MKRSKWWWWYWYYDYCIITTTTTAKIIIIEKKASAKILRTNRLNYCFTNCNKHLLLSWSKMYVSVQHSLSLSLSPSLSAHARRRHVEVSRSLILCIYPVLQCFNSVESYMYVYVALLWFCVWIRRGNLVIYNGIIDINVIVHCFFYSWTTSTYAARHDVTCYLHEQSQSQLALICEGPSRAAVSSCVVIV